MVDGGDDHESLSRPFRMVQRFLVLSHRSRVKGDDEQRYGVRRRRKEKRMVTIKSAWTMQRSG